MDLIVLLFPLFALWTGNVLLWLCGVYMYLVVSNLGKTQVSQISIFASLAIITGASITHRYNSSFLVSLWKLCIFVYCGSTIVLGTPEFFVKGFGCGKVTSTSKEWGHTMKIAEHAIPGEITLDNHNLKFQCPSEFGIMVTTNNTFKSKIGWKSICDNTISRHNYNQQPMYIDPSELPAAIGYMCLAYNVDTWYYFPVCFLLIALILKHSFRFQATFNIDRKLRAEIESHVAEYASEYSNSVWYNTMMWSAVGIIVGVLIISVSTSTEPLSSYRMLGVWAHSILMIASAIALTVSIGVISQKAARQYLGRKQHQSWGLVALVAIVINVFLGLLIVFGSDAIVKRFRVLHRLIGTLAFILVLVASSISLIHFMEWSTSAVVSIAVVLALLVIYSTSIKFVFKNERVEKETNPIYEADAEYTKNLNTFRSSKRKPKQLYF